MFNTSQYIRKNNIFQVLKQTGEGEALPHFQSAFFSFKLQVDHCWEIQQSKTQHNKAQMSSDSEIKVNAAVSFFFFPNFTCCKTPLDI